MIVGVAQERLERAVAEDLVGDLVGDPHALGGADQGLLGLHDLLQRLPHSHGELALVELGVVQRGAERLEQRLVHLALDAGERVDVAHALARVASGVGDLARQPSARPRRRPVSAVRTSSRGSAVGRPAA